MAFASWGPSAARSAARRANAGGLVTSRTVDGLRINLQVSATREPFDALIRSHLTVANVSGRSVGLVDNGCLPAASVQVLNDRGKVQPPVGFAGVWECADAGPRLLEPGARLTSSPLVVLQADQLRPEVTIFAAGSSRQLTGSTIRLRLTHSRSPRVVVHSGSAGRAGGFTASVLAAWRHSGPLYVQSLESCTEVGGGGMQTGSSRWGAIKGFTLRTSILHPTCHSQLWHFYAGWVGRPIAKFRLVVPRGSQPRY